MSIPLRTAAVVLAGSGADRMARIVCELRKVPVDEIYVVCFESASGAIAAARRHGARVVEAAASSTRGEALALGVARSRWADALLCTDGRFIYPAEWLRPHVAAVLQGADVVLNDISSLPTPLSHLELCAAFLNYACGAIRAGSNSLMFFPFSLSRRAVERIGTERLARLPAALLAAHLEGLRVEAVGPVPTWVTDPLLRAEKEEPAAARAEALGQLREHLAALAELLAVRGPRGSFSDHNRRRDLLEEGSRNAGAHGDEQRA